MEPCYEARCTGPEGYIEKPFCEKKNPVYFMLKFVKTPFLLILTHFSYTILSQKKNCFNKIVQTEIKNTRVTLSALFHPDALRPLTPTNMLPCLILSKTRHMLIVVAVSNFTCDQQNEGSNDLALLHQY
jgi:hypothetical protein